MPDSRFPKIAKIKKLNQGWFYIETSISLVTRPVVANTILVTM